MYAVIWPLSVVPSLWLGVTEAGPTHDVTPPGHSHQCHPHKVTGSEPGLICALKTIVRKLEEKN